MSLSFERAVASVDANSSKRLDAIVVRTRNGGLHDGYEKVNSQSTLATLVSVTAVGLLALLGAFAIVVDPSVLRRILRPIIGAAVGVLLGEALLHLIPDSIAQTHSVGRSLDWVGAGVITFAAFEFALRKWMRSESGITPAGMISAAAEALHNALDGALIASTYLVDFRAGMLATAAVALHEIPHELGNVAVLLHAGYPPRRAVLINLGSATAAVLSAIAVLCIGGRARGLTVYATPLASGGFLYLAVGVLAPDLWRTASRGQKLVQSLGAALGFILTAAVAWVR